MTTVADTLRAAKVVFEARGNGAVTAIYDVAPDQQTARAATRRLRDHHDGSPVTRAPSMLRTFERAIAAEEAGQ